MKRYFIIPLLACSLLSASVLKEDEQQRILKEKEKALLESQIQKESWINPLRVEGDFNRAKTKDSTTHTKKVYLNFEQDIFRSGGIFYTIKKGKLQEQLAYINYDDNLNQSTIQASTYALQLKKIDLQLQQQTYLVHNKILEIEKKQSQYLNSIIDIEELDSAVIEKNDLLIQTEDLKIERANLLKSFHNLSQKDYQSFEVALLEIVSIESYIQKNTPLFISSLEQQINQKEVQIENSSYLPKISLYSQLGYEKAHDASSYESFNSSGIKLSIPLDYSMNEKRQVKQINYQISKLQHNLKEQEQRNQHSYLMQAIDSVKNKIMHSKTTIQSYEQILELTQGLYEGLLKTKQDVQTIENRLASSKLDVKIFALQEQIYIYELYKNIQK